EVRLELAQQAERFLAVGRSAQLGGAIAEQLFEQRACISGIVNDEDACAAGSQVALENGEQTVAIDRLLEDVHGTEQGRAVLLADHADHDNGYLRELRIALQLGKEIPPVQL